MSKIGNLVVNTAEAVARLFCWWRSFDFGPRGRLVLVPDHGTLLWVVLLPACFLPFFLLSKYSVAFLAYVPLSPFVFTGLLWISPSRVRWFKLFLFIPYWVRHVPSDATFSIYDAMGGPEPSGVAFESESRPRYLYPTGYCIHIGTARSAAALFLYISTALKQSGWNETWRGLQKTSTNSSEAL